MPASEKRETFAMTVLGENVLRLYSLTGYEALSEPFQLSLQLASDSRENAPLDQAALLGTVVKVTVDKDYTAVNGLPDHPPRYFNDRVIQVIDHVLATPDLRDPIALTQPGVLYEYADPKIEALSAGQKLLIRMGSDNATFVKHKLRELRAALVVQPKTK